MRITLLTFAVLASFLVRGQKDEATTSTDTSRKQGLLDDRFNIELSFMPLDLYTRPGYSISYKKHFFPHNLRGIQLKMILKQKHALRFSFQDYQSPLSYMIKGLKEVNNEQYRLARLGYEKTLFKGRLVKFYAMADLTYMNTKADARENYRWDRPNSQGPGKIIYDSIFYLSHTVRSFVVLPGLGITMYEPHGFFLSAEMSYGAGYYTKNISSRNVIDYQETLNGQKVNGYRKEKDTEVYEYKGAFFFANVLRISFGCLF